MRGAGLRKCSWQRGKPAVRGSIIMGGAGRRGVLAGMGVRMDMADMGGGMPTERFGKEPIPAKGDVESGLGCRVSCD